MSRFFYILFGISYTVMIIYPICDESQDSKDSISNIVYEIFKSKNETFNAFNAITTKLMMHHLIIKLIVSLIEK